MKKGKPRRCECTQAHGTSYWRCCVCDNWIWMMKQVPRCSMCAHVKGTTPIEPGDEPENLKGQST